MAVPRVSGSQQRRNRMLQASSSAVGGPSEMHHRQRLRRMQVISLVLVASVVAMTGIRYYSRINPNPVQFLDSKRIFGPASTDDAITSSTNNVMVTFNSHEQRLFLEQNGWACQASFTNSRTLSQNLLLERFDALPSGYAVELWKYCLLYTNPGFYWDVSMAMPMQLIGDIVSSLDNTNLAISIMDNTDKNSDGEVLHHQSHLHHSMLRIRERHSKVALGMIRYLLEADSLTPTSLHETLALFVANDVHKKRATWKFFSAGCKDRIPVPIMKRTESSNPTVTVQIQNKQSLSAMNFSPGMACSAKNGEPCCQVWPANDKNMLPVLSLMHSHFLTTPEDESANRANAGNPLPFLYRRRTDASKIKDNDLGMPVDHLPYIATVREVKTNAPPATLHETPNFFDLLLRNNCLPPDKECYKCLKLGYKEGDEGGDCNSCADKCPCYCKALCSIRPPPKRLAAIWEVTPPRYRMDPSHSVIHL